MPESGVSIPIIFLVITLAGAGIQIFLNRQDIDLRRAAAITLTWFLAIEVGLGGIWAFIGHTLFADQVAQSIGWPTGNPFQQEVALANLAFGVLGLLSIKMDGSFRLATILSYSIFMVGAGIGHLHQLVVFHNTAVNNAGVILYADFLLPGVLVVLYCIAGEYPGKKAG